MSIDELSVALTPNDEHNQQLAANLRPTNWTNPQSGDPYQLVVIGAGTAGLVAAAGAASLGARVALVERELMGGDCLNFGCVPSKALIRAARVAATARDAGQFGVQVAADPPIDFAAVMARMRRHRAEISLNDSAERFTDLGVDVYFGEAAFDDDRTVTVTQQGNRVSQLRFKKAVVATGARAATPTIPGIETVDYLTNESLFSLTELPARLGIVGGGPIGCEMAQTFARFGSQVVLLDRNPRILPREDPAASEILAQQMRRDGVQIVVDSQDLELASGDDGSVRIKVSRNGQREEFFVDRLLVATGRRPNVETLNLDAAHVQHNSRGVEVNEYLQTSNPNIYAAGDVCSRHKFTHAADFQARAVIQNALFAIGPFGRKKASDLIIPWATFTSPEIAHVGPTPDELNRHGRDVDTYVQPLADIDRAILDGQQEGFVKVHTAAGTDRILAATIVAENAGDLISEVTLAMQNGLGLGKIGATIHPYPTQAEAIRKLGDQYRRTKLTPKSRRVLKLLMRWNT